MPNVTPHTGAGVFSIESYEASESRNKKARFKHRGGASRRGKRKRLLRTASRQRHGKAERWGLKDGAWRTEGLREAFTGRSGRQAAGCCMGLGIGKRELLNKTHRAPLSWQNPCICAVPHARRRPARLLQQCGSESSWSSLRGQVLLAVCTRKRQLARNGYLRRMGRAMSTNVFGLANRFPGWRLLRS
jgi:hypothetical protein